MYKILIIPKAEYLTEFDTGMCNVALDLLAVEELKARERWCLPKNRGSIFEDKRYRATKERLKVESDTIIAKAKTQLALINSRDKADTLIKYYIERINSEFQKCEFEVVRAKK